MTRQQRLQAAKRLVASKLKERRVYTSFGAWSAADRMLSEGADEDAIARQIVLAQLHDGVIIERKSRPTGAA